MLSSEEFVLVLDFGAQYSQLIARRVRELNVFSEIEPFNYPIKDIVRRKPKGIILSGGPSSVYEAGAPQIDKALFDLGIPVLGICYGMQLMAYLLDGVVTPSDEREYGAARIFIKNRKDLFANLPEVLNVWMSHGDRIEKIPPNFQIIATSENSPVASMKHKELPLFGVQFHPEVSHTDQGLGILKNFVMGISKARPGWEMKNFIGESIEVIRKRVGKERVICGLSGGVDSSVVASLIHKAIGDQLTCIFVDNGLLRSNEVTEVKKIFGDVLKIDLKVIDAADKFLSDLSGVIDPEEKRKRIGGRFIDVFEEEAKQIKGAAFLAQGTLYPDVIESVSLKGPSSVIKSHHNVGGLPQKMNLKLLEPVRDLFKDEVRKLGQELGLPDPVLKRHPFPGPGLAVRIIGEVTKANLEILRKADAIVTEEIIKSALYNSLWQVFPVFLPLKTVGVMGDERTYESVIAIRAVQSSDGMTANWAELPYPLLNSMSSRILNEVKGINRVVYDISSKPPATIEWE
ncbi:MAG: glutamine-hydrolyzing GMP synthase [Deltaproteobacteria bacterium RIFCSPHIGHO2_12_FULL_43_9]|nr:MAG: glutamine-hydrolyzing GMP synthase [Deltaproteobacteria bacterium RIFCSPHIGHO2_12_FULL_43_9]